MFALEVSVSRPRNRQTPWRDGTAPLGARRIMVRSALKTAKLFRALSQTTRDTARKPAALLLPPSFPTTSAASPHPSPSNCGHRREHRHTWTPPARLSFTPTLLQHGTIPHLRAVTRGDEDDGTLSGEFVEHVGQVAVLVLGGEEEVLLDQLLGCRELVSHLHLGQIDTRADAAGTTLLYENRAERSGSVLGAV